MVTAGFYPLYELMSVVDVENEYAVAAIAQVIANAGRGNIQVFRIFGCVFFDFACYLREYEHDNCEYL